VIGRPLVSVAIPCYNHERYIQDCIKSVIGQDYENIELIIIDDGSSDNSVEKIKEMIPACEERFVHFEFRHRDNKGLSATLNEAIEWCRGAYYSTIASDDVLLPKKTSTLLRYMEEDKDVAGIFCGCYILDGNGKKIDSLRAPEKLYSFEDIFFRKYNIIAPTQLLRLDCVQCVGGYPENLYVEDWYMWLALTEKGYKLRVVDGLLVGYRQHENNSSKNALKMHDGRVEVLKYFSENPLQKKAVAINYLFASIDFTSISKIKAAKFLFESVSYNKEIIFSPLFASCLLRLVIPRFVFAQAKKLKCVLVGNSKDIVT